MKLTQEQKRIKIAQAQGFKFSPTGRSIECPFWGQPVPDYFNDLNACHEMENHLGESIVKYRDMLADFLGDDLRLGWAIHAKSELRAECFGLTLNLWKVGK